jgi:hypothetical protein
MHTRLPILVRPEILDTEDQMRRAGELQVKKPNPEIFKIRVEIEGYCHRAFAYPTFCTGNQLLSPGHMLRDVL